MMVLWQSMSGTKIMITGEGGMLVTNSSSLYRRAKLLSSEGKDPKKTFWIKEIGMRYAMSNMQAAMGTIQLSRINELVSKKRKIFAWYKKRLGKLDGITINTERSNCRTNYWMPVVILDKRFGTKKEELIKKLAEYDIDSRPFFYPLSLMPPFKQTVDNPVSYGVSPYGVYLPSPLNITEDEVDYVCSVLTKVLKI